MARVLLFVKFAGDLKSLVELNWRFFAASSSETYLRGDPNSFLEICLIRFDLRSD